VLGAQVLHPQRLALAREQAMVIEHGSSFPFLDDYEVIREKREDGDGICGFLSCTVFITIISRESNLISQCEFPAGR
jgi:hypothetical protein